jgi:hypothetical protein
LLWVFFLWEKEGALASMAALRYDQGPIDDPARTL